jgi:P4 family phage/plasmid primase-like protien
MTKTAEKPTNNALTPVAEFAVSLFKDRTDNQPVMATTDWLSLVHLLSTHAKRPQKDGFAWSAACYAQEGATRRNEDVLALSVLVYDFDNAKYDQVREDIHHWGVRALAHSTFSHCLDKPYFRLVIPVSRPISPSEWPKIWIVGNALLSGAADPQTKDLSRLYYLPSCPAERFADRFTEVFEGKAADVEDMLAAAKEILKPSVAKTTDSNGRTNLRLVADDVKKNMEPSLWFHQGQFRTNLDGYWQPLLRRTLEQRILLRHEDLTSRGVGEVVDTLERLCCEEREWSAADIRLICLKNGTLDPVTGALSPHSPEPRLLYGLDVDWEEAAEAPVFRRVLQEYWGEEKDYQERVLFLEEWLGYLLYPRNIFAKFLFLQGNGGNGKSIIAGVMERLVGRENVSYGMLERLGNPAVRANLEGKLLNLSPEINAEATLSDGYLKAVTSGDTIDVEEKYRSPRSFKPYVKLVATTNHLPRLKDTSDGFSRRAVILTFARSFPPEMQDVLLEEKLEAERAGILRMAVEGLKRLLERGYFIPPPSSIEIVESYRNESDPVRLFVSECVIEGGQEETGMEELYGAFREWAAAAGFSFILSRPRFGRALSTLGIPSRKSNSVTWRRCALKEGVKRSSKVPPPRYTRTADLDAEMGS